MSSTLRHKLPRLRTETIVSRNEPEINPICLLGEKKKTLAVLRSRLAQHLVPGTCEHPATKTETKVSHTVQRICGPLRIGNAAGLSPSSALLLHNFFAFCAYFSRLSVTQPTKVVLAI